MGWEPGLDRPPGLQGKLVGSAHTGAVPAGAREEGASPGLVDSPDGLGARAELPPARGGAGARTACLLGQVRLSAPPRASVTGGAVLTSSLLLGPCPVG